VIGAGSGQQLPHVVRVKEHGLGVDGLRRVHHVCADPPPIDKKVVGAQAADPDSRALDRASRQLETGPRPQLPATAQPGGCAGERSRGGVEGGGAADLRAIAAAAGAQPHAHVPGVGGVGQQPGGGGQHQVLRGTARRPAGPGLVGPTVPHRRDADFVPERWPRCVILCWGRSSRSQLLSVRRATTTALGLEPYDFQPVSKRT
jgi:hypothetical protein